MLALIGELEKHNGIQAPTQDLSLVEGDWRLLYSTITITVRRRARDARGAGQEAGCAGCVLATPGPELACATHGYSSHPQGVKRTKLGLREFVKLGDFIQRIDTQDCVAVGGGASGRLPLVHVVCPAPLNPKPHGPCAF